ncbi:beta strand repeat-containing protein, partial [Pseudahrensia aquimaris]
MADSNITSGIDNIDGVEGENNTVRGGAEFLTSDDTVEGSTLAGDVDSLRLDEAGTVDSSDLTNVRHFERLYLEVGGISFTLTNAFVASADSNVFFIFGSSGDDTIDASAVTAAAPQVRVILGLGSDSYIGSDNDELFIFSSGQLDGDTISAGGGIDVMDLAAGTAISATDLANVTGIEKVVFRGDGSVTVVDNFITGGRVDFLVSGAASTTNQTIDASGVTTAAVGAKGLIYQTSGGTDTILGSEGRDNVYFDVGKGELDATDTVDTGDGFDTFTLTNTSGGAATVAASAFTGVSNLEYVALVSQDAITVELTDISSDGVIRVVAKNGDHTIDTQAVTATTVFTAGDGDQTLIGGAGRDNLQIAADQLDGSDTFDGGDGFDSLTFFASGTVDAADFANVTNFEQIILRKGGTVEIADSVANGSTFRVINSSSVDIVDASAETSAKFFFRLIGTDDEMIGGAADDRFEVSETDFASIDGGDGGLNRIYTNSGVTALDLTDPALVSNIANIQVVELGGDDATLSIDAAGVTAISGTANALYVLGNVNDSVIVSDQWTEVGPHSNAFVSRTESFTEYTHSSGATLYIADNAATTIEIVAAPTDLALDVSSVDENADGAIIGNLTVVDSNTNETFTFATDDSRFEVVDNGLGGFALKLVSGVTLDRETEASADVEVTVTDSEGMTYSETFTIDVNDLDDNPATDPVDTDLVQPDAVAENAAVGTYTGLLVSSTDADATAGALTYQITGGTGLGLFSVDAGGLVRVDGSIDYETAASYTLEITATPASGSPSQVSTFTIAVTDVNEFTVTPVIDSDTASNTVAENSAVGTAVGITASASDADGTNNTVSYAIVGGTGAAFFAIDPTSGVVTVAGAIDREVDGNSLYIDVEATSADGSTSVKTFTINVVDENDTAPVFTSPNTADVDENTTAVATLTATDADTVGGPASFAITAGAGDGALFKIVNGNELEFIDAPDFEVPDDDDTNGVYEVTVEANDGANTSSQTITVTVTDANEAPTAVALDNSVTTVAENTVIGSGIKVADITIT